MGMIQLIGYSIMMVILGLFAGCLITLLTQGSKDNEAFCEWDRTCIKFHEVYEILDDFRPRSDGDTAVIMDSLLDMLQERFEEEEKERQ